MHENLNNEGEKKKKTPIGDSLPAVSFLNFGGRNLENI